MTLTHAERVERDRNELRQRLDDLGISVAEYVILNHIHFGCHRPRHVLAKFAACPDYALGESISIKDAARAVRSCFKRGLLRVISQRDLADLKRDVAEKEYLGPIYDFPPVGGVDFTDRGAEVWLEIELWESKHLREWPPRGFAYLDSVEISTRWTFVSRAGMYRQRRLLRKELDCLVMTAPTRLDRVRLAGWSEPVPGWTFDATEQLQRQGRGGGGSFLSWDTEIACSDLPLVRRGCRRYRITLSELCVLMSIARWGANDARQTVLFALAFGACRLNVRVSHAKIVAAVRSGLEKGLLAKLTADDVHLMKMTRDSTCPPLVPGNPQPNSIALSETGSRFLIEQGPKILGSAWLDGWSVSREVFRREHRYARNLLDVAAVFEEYSGKSKERVQINAVEEIGPWCVDWWKRFPRGYRIELEITPEGIR